LSGRRPARILPEGGIADVLDVADLPIDVDALQARIDQLGAIGTHPNGGLYRALYTDAWVEAMALLRSWLEEAGLTVRFDAVGNLWGRAEGSEGGSAVVSGSHVDTVRQGGKYDGALGVHMAITAVRALLQTAGRPKPRSKCWSPARRRAAASTPPSGAPAPSSGGSGPTSPTGSSIRTA